MCNLRSLPRCSLHSRVTKAMNTPKGQPRQEDRLSSLPDEILHHIFNFLTAKHAARTCVLSRRWAHVWSSCPNLHFDEQEFPHSIQGIELYHRQFMNFADRVILLSNASNLNCVSFSAREGTDMSRVMSWLYNMIKRNVRDLTIYSEQGEPIMLPFHVVYLQSLKRFSFTVLRHLPLSWPRPPRPSLAAALEDLTLCGLKFVDIATDAISSSCPRLKTWKMERCTDLHQLDVNCPNLEIFCMHGCEGIQDLVISGSSLVTINISDTFIRADKGTTTTFEISAPNLRNFAWSDNPVSRYKSSKMAPSRTWVRLKSVLGRDVLLSLNETRHLTIDCISLWVCFSFFHNFASAQAILSFKLMELKVIIYRTALLTKHILNMPTNSRWITGGGWNFGKGV